MSKSALFKQFKTDSNSETQGIKFYPTGDNADGTRPCFILARLGGTNYEYQRIREEIVRPFQRELDNNMLSPKKQQELNIEIFLRACLRGWEHVQDEQGKEIAYSPKVARDLLLSLPDLYQELAFQAARLQNYQAGQQEVLEKN